jgi:rsbT co-antagonist protein RsbR
MQQIRSLFRPNISDQNLRRQGFLVMIVSLALFALAVILVLNSIRQNGWNFTAVSVAIGGLIYVACAAMARMGLVRPAAYLISWVPMVGMVAILLVSPSPIAVFFFSIPIMFSSIALSSRQVIPIAILALLTTLFAASRDQGADNSVYFVATFFVILISVLAYLGAWSVEQAIGIARAAEHALIDANNALRESNTDLENRVLQRTADLQQREVRLQQAFTEQQQTLAELRRSHDIIRELSAPILPVAPGVLIAPIIGAIDSERAAFIINGLLSATERERARFLILDVTGIPVIDTQVAQVLLKAAQSARLLGTQVMLTGIRPEVAQTLVGLGVELRSIVTHGTLQSGIANALRS